MIILLCELMVFFRHIGDSNVTPPLCFVLCCPSLYLSFLSGSPVASPPFCRSSAVSLSAFFNNGALPCGCHEAGAESDTCQPFGGQCQCRPNVIGRDCSQCATGYWGFPNCRRELPRGVSVSVCVSVCMSITQECELLCVCRRSVTQRVAVSVCSCL